MTEFPEPTYIGDVIRMKYVDKLLPKGVPENGNFPKCLDVGAGQGIAYHIVTEKGYSYVGADINESHVILKMDAEDLKEINSEKLDVVLSVDVLEHLHHPEKAIKEAWRILKPGGIMICHVPNKDQTHVLVQPVEQDDHVRKGFSQEELFDLFRQLDDVKITPTFGVPECIAWELVYAQRMRQGIDPMDIARFDWSAYQNLGWIVVAQKGVKG